MTDQLIPDPAVPLSEAPQAPENPPVVLCAHPTLPEALAHAQSDFPIIPRSHHAEIETKSGGKYTYDYADMGDIIEAVKPILYRCGLSITQPIGFDGDTDFVKTRLLHVSGEKVKSRMRLTLQQATPQATGSLITYFRRYAYCAILGIVSDKDDDGTLAEAAYGKAGGTRKRRPPAGSTSTRSGANSARARTDPATDGHEGMSAKDRNKLISHLAHLDPPIRGGDAQALKIKALLDLEEQVPIIKLTTEQGDKLFEMLGIEKS